MKAGTTTSHPGVRNSILMEAPPPCLWDLGFGRSGLYYEGVVDDLEKSVNSTK